MRRGSLIVVSGPSGAGKSTLIRAALDAIDDLAYSVSATTRRPRDDEVNGRDYIFLSREEFEEWISEGRFLEWAEYSGNLYGRLGVLILVCLVLVWLAQRVFARSQGNFAQEL